jgi:hypothetical protein
VDAAFDWFLSKAGGADVVVLRASGGDGYHDCFIKLGKLDSVETIVFRSAEASHDPLCSIAYARPRIFSSPEAISGTTSSSGRTLLSRMRFMPLCAGACRSGERAQDLPYSASCVLSRA